MKRPRTQAAPLLTFGPRDRLVQAVGELLQHAMAQLEQPERLNKARERNLTALSSLLRHAQTLLSAIIPPQRAVRTVVTVQRSLVMAMLSATTFNLQLAGVREINAMLESVQPAPRRPLIGPSLLADDAPLGGGGAEEGDAGAAENAALAVAWLEAENVLSLTLRSHLHLKQYVEQVERIMRFLLRHGRLREEHLDFVWGATEKQDTFEETKANLFALLASLAVDFSPSQLDSCAPFAARLSLLACFQMGPC